MSIKLKISKKTKVTSKKTSNIAKVNVNYNSINHINKFFIVKEFKVYIECIHYTKIVEFFQNIYVNKGYTKSISIAYIIRAIINDDKKELLIFIKNSSIISTTGDIKRKSVTIFIQEIEIINTLINFGFFTFAQKLSLIVKYFVIKYLIK